MDESSSRISEAESLQLERPQGRKRLRFEENWAKNKQKRRKDQGKSYKAYCGSGETSEKKKLVPVSCKCQFSCPFKVTIAERKHIYKEFYKLSNHDQQNKYLYGLISRISPVKRKKGAASSRRNTFMYHVR